MRLLLCFAIIVLGIAWGLSYLLEWRDEVRRGSA